MKYSTIAMLTLSFSFCSQVVANSSIKLNQMNDDLIKDRLKKAEMLSSKLVDIKSATLDFFIENNRFPVNKEELVADGFYFGNYNSVYGNEITYTVNSNTVKFSVNVNDANTASIISGMISSNSSGSTVEYQFGKPSQASIISTSLSRVWDGDPSRNTMTTNLIMDGNDLLEVNDVEANSVRAAGGVYDEGVRVFSEKNLPTKNHVGLSKVENYSVSNSYSGSRSDFYASEKAVGDSYRTLVAKIDALTKGDVGLSNVPNYGSTNSYTSNNTNLFATQSAVYGAYVNLRDSKLGKNDKAANSNLLDNLDSSAFARSSLTINGNKLTGSFNLDKSDVGLSNVPNYAATNSYTSNNTNLFATQRAVNSAYIYLRDNKLGKSDKAVNSDKLDNLDSSAFARSSLTINGHKLTGSFNLDKSDVGLSRVSNYSATNSYTGDSSTLYATQRAVNSAWKDLDNKLANFEVKDADTIDGFDSSDFVKTTLKINGKALTSNITITKGDVGLSNVPNYAATNVYTANRTDLLATQRAVYDAYTALNNSKLDKNSKASDSDKVDGIDGASIVQTSRTINGKNLGSNITLTKGDIGLSEVRNYGISDSFTGSSSEYYASQKAVGDLNDSLSSLIADKGKKGKYKHYVYNKNRYIVYCDSDTRYMVTSGQGSIGSSTGVEIERALPVYYDRIYSISADLVGSTKAVASEGIVHKFSIANIGTPWSTKVTLIYNNDDGVNDADAYTFNVVGRARNNCDF